MITWLQNPAGSIKIPGERTELNSPMCRPSRSLIHHGSSSDSRNSEAHPFGLGSTQPVSFCDGVRMSSSGANSTISKVWGLLLLVVTPLPAVWALANPMFASPDEPAHIIRAQGVIRGDFHEPYITDGVPADAATCIAFNSEATADCMNLTWGDPSTPRPSSTNNYPPLFHLIAGVPSIVFSGLGGAYIMRLWMVLVCGALFALSATLLWLRDRNRWTIASLYFAMTPMVVFTMATVNPSGLTASLAAVIWSSGVSLVKPRGDAPTWLIKSAFATSLILFPMLRRDALVWELVILLLIATLLTRHRLRELLHDRVMLGVLAITAGVMMWVWVSWSSSATDSFIANSAAQGDGSWAAGLGSLYSYVLQMVGWFGWLDSPISNEMFGLVLLILGTFVVAGLAGGPSAESRTSSLALATLLLTPIGIGAVRFPYVQGRYLFPIFIGLMLMCGQSLAQTDLPRRFTRRILFVLGSSHVVVHFFAFTQNLRRYSVGRTGTWRFFAEARWHPPMMSNLTAIILAIGAILLSVICFGRVVSGLESGITFDPATDVEAAK